MARKRYNLYLTDEEYKTIELLAKTEGYEKPEEFAREVLVRKYSESKNRIEKLENVLFKQGCKQPSSNK